MPDKSSDSFCELSVRRNVKSIETFTKQLDELSSEGEQLHEGGDGEGGWVVLVHVVDLVDFKQVPKKSVQLHVDNCWTALSSSLNQIRFPTTNPFK